MAKALLDLTVNEITRRWPEAMAVLHRHGIDLCCGGWMILRRAAAEAGADAERLLDDLAQSGLHAEEAMEQ